LVYNNAIPHSLNSLQFVLKVKKAKHYKQYNTQLYELVSNAKINIKNMYKTA